MTETIEFTETEEKTIVTDVTNNARKVYIVGLGAASYTVTSSADYAKNARTNIGDLANLLVERGEETNQKTRDMVTKQTENRQKDLRKTQKRFEKEVSKRMDSLLHAINIPSKKDITSLNNKVTRLNKKVNDLVKAEQAAQS
ncbi:MAG: phasin family protein [Chloroflexi bacterium]|nr:phasin family protein [Chloroflexota bacterium]